MKELQMNIPSSWSEISIGRFEEIAKIEGENPYEKTIQLLEILTGLSDKDIRALPVTALESTGLTEKLSFLAKEPRKVMPRNEIKLNGTTYVMSLYPTKWTAGQYLDYNASLSAAKEKKIATIIACFAVPEGHKYGDGYDFESVVNDINEYMSIEEGIGYSDFFHLQLESFKEALRAYTERKKRKSTRRQARK